MKVGGNESATKFFQRNGGTAALASKDPKTKYTSNAANKYKDELARRVQVDQKQFPDEVVITDVVDDAGKASDGTSTPAAEGDDDFFSSWDKPTIKRPSNPPSRTGTPLSRGQSPFLKPGEQNGNGAARPKSPLSAATNDAAPTSTPSAIRTTSSSAVRKTGTGATGAKKPNILGGKKKGLGAKKVDASALDFDAAERKAKEEAERIEKLGYNPDDEAAATSAVPAAAAATETNILSPTPVSPRAGGFSPTHNRERSESEMERLGMGMGRLGFGQTAGAKPTAKPAAKSMGGFGSTSRPQDDDSEKFARQKFGTQKGISSDEFFGRGNFDSNAQSEAKSRLQGFEGATSISSNAYFGRPEDDPADMGEYGDLETAAKDFVRRFGITAGDDLETVMGLANEGSRKLMVSRSSFVQTLVMSI
jgi:ADP-ribosylation factor GTPase-activating protein 2/3